MVMAHPPTLLGGGGGGGGGGSLVKTKNQQRVALRTCNFSELGQLWMHVIRTEAIALQSN